MQATQPNAAHTGPAAVLNQTRLDSTDDNLRMPLLLFTDDEADTLVYINPAPQQVSSSVSHRWDFGPPQVESQVIPHRVHSRKLLATGSEALKDHFRPRNQARVRKRYGLTNDMRPGIKYAIDLTPPTEGEEAVIFMTELSCPMGVREWYRKQSRWALPLSCVGGQDEREWIETEWPQADDDSSTQEPVVVQSSDTESPVEANMKKRRAKTEVSNENINGIRRKMNWQGNLPTLRPDLLPSEPPAYSETGDAMDLPPFKQDLDPFKKKSIRVPGRPLEYSPVSHRTCLERIMHAIEGLDPKLDTAPKLWTYFALAKVLQVSKFPAVGDHILAWLYNQSNTTFVEVNPELAYQIACGLQNRYLCQTSFAILVGEESLLVLESLIDGKIPKRQTLTLHGRTRESLDDSEVQRVEYASKVFLDRILRIFVDLAGTRMEWVEKLVENCLRERLSDLSTYRTSIDELIEVCKLYVRAQIYQTLMEPIIPSNDFKVKYASDDPLAYPGTEYSNSYIVMPRFCRVLTRTFWKSIATGLPELNKLQNWHHLSLWNLAPAIPNLENETTAFFQCVPKQEVRQAIQKLRQEVDEAVFDFSVFQLDVQVHIANVASLVAGTPKYEMDEFYVPFDIVDSLVCLQEDEFKFLPLWAGGNDDGSGGVFDDQSVPILENGGFATAGPSVHLDRGQGFPDDIASLDSFESIRPDEAASTIQRASHEATDSHATTVVSVATSVSSDFELVGGVETMELRSVNGSCSVVDGDGDTVIDALLHDDAESDSFEDEFGCDDDDDDDDDDDQMI